MLISICLMILYGLLMLIQEVLLGLLRSKTVIYVTHQVELLPAVDLILLMKVGNITQAGKSNDILKSGTDYMGLVGAHQQALSVLGSKEGGLVSRKKSMNKENGGMDTTNGVTMKKGNEDVQTDKVGEVAGPKGQLVQEEEKEKGRVGFSKYWQHITTAYGGAVVPFILLAQIFFQILQIGSNYWMALATPKPAFGSSTLIIVYVALALGSSFCIFARSTYLATTGFETATLLFNKMHLCLFRAPMSFFDATPSGRARKRASTDQSAVDLNIASQVGAFAFSMVQLLGIMTVMSQAA